jgi:hypothetical protein
MLAVVGAESCATQAPLITSMHSFSGLATHEEREGRPLMILQTGYFDDSGSDVGSQYYVLAGFIASVEQWKAFSNKWAETLNKEPALRYFKMSEAMAMDGQFRRGWTVPLCNQRILELVDIVAEFDPPRIECFLKRSHFNDFVKDIISGDSFSNPYFLLFYHLVLSVAANAKALNWSPDCNFIFDEQGKIGDITVNKWNWVKQNIDVAGAPHITASLGSPPTFRNDVKFRPLQVADILAWLVRECMTFGPDKMEDITRAALKHIEGEDKIVRIHIDKTQLMTLGAKFLVGKARLDGHL